MMTMFAILTITTCLYWSITTVGVNLSPTGDFSVKMYWTDVGGWGWQGKVYLVEHGFVDKNHWTGHTVPASSKWLSDYEFEIYGGLWPMETQVYSVYDFIN